MKHALAVIEGGKNDTGRDWLRELYSKFGGAVFGRCRSLLKNDAAAEDAMQEVFARAWVNGREFRGESSVLTWLMKISTHHCLNVIRADTAPWKTHYSHLQASRGEAHGGAQFFEDRDWVQKLLLRFELETQQAVIHYFVDEMTLEEVAALLDRSVPTVRKRLRAFAAETGEVLRADLSEDE